VAWRSLVFFDVDERLALLSGVGERLSAGADFELFRSVLSAWPLPPGRAAADGLPARPSQDDHAGCRPAYDRHGGADGAVNGDWFEAYVGQVLAPDLRHGDVVIMDNLSSHKRAGVRTLIKAAGARLLFLPPYSPDFNPIEKAFARLKAMLRKAGEQTVSGLWSLIGKLVDRFEARDGNNTLSFKVGRAERLNSLCSDSACAEMRFGSSRPQSTAHSKGDVIMLNLYRAKK
jgi:transposase